MGKFELGQCVTTPAAAAAMDRTDADPVRFLIRHAFLDPGALGPEDYATNVRAVKTGARVFSAYRLPDETKIWIITEADRSVTTILLPEEY